ncbi:hypothetical protein [Absidia glauca]|uniref:Uncharacterized protein n=1 Tax=Absidia glauca TaxID=4829 RepID=A0A168SCZ8_ABSGL|nr:hypothetical protein [Absidia glauca]
MGTTKSRKTRRNTSRPAAIDFLTNIPLGTAGDTKEALSYSFNYSDDNKNNSNNNSNNSNDQHYDDHIGYSGYHDPTLEDDNRPSDMAALSLHSSDSNSTTDGDHPPPALPLERPDYSLPFASSFLTSGPLDHVLPQTAKKKQQDQRRRSSSSDSSHEHFKLTREDSERPIASEKIKKKSAGGKEHAPGGTTIMSVFRYYTDKIRQSTNKRKNEKTSKSQVGYVQQQQLATHDHHRRRVGLSYAHFLSPIGTLLYVQPLSPTELF